jgi:heat shock protein HslJ
MLTNILQKKTIWLLFMAMTLLVVACTPDGSQSGNVPVDRTPQPTEEQPTEEPNEEQVEEITMYVGSEMVNCEGVARQACFQVKFEKDAEWELLYSGIDGFEFEPGFEYELRVNKFTVENPPADASAIRYELVEIISQSETESAEIENLDFLLNTAWDLVMMNGEAPIDSAVPTISFEDEAVNGTTGCNSYFGSYTLDGTNLSVGQVGQTEMFCEDRMEQEQAYLQMLMSAVSLILENDTLTIHTEQGDLVYQPAEHQALEGTAWVLSGIATGDAIANTWVDEQITAEFLDGNMGGSSGCNSYGADYETSGSAITLGEVVGTLMACEDEEVMEREAEFLAALQNVATFEIVRNNLTFFDADGNVVMTFVAYV